MNGFWSYKKFIDLFQTSPHNMQYAVAHNISRCIMVLWVKLAFVYVCVWMCASAILVSHSLDIIYWRGGDGGANQLILYSYIVCVWFNVNIYQIMQQRVVRKFSASSIGGIS